MEGKWGEMQKKKKKTVWVVKKEGSQMKGEKIMHKRKKDKDVTAAGGKKALDCPTMHRGGKRRRAERVGEETCAICTGEIERGRKGHI